MFESAIALSTHGDNSGFDSSKAYSNLGVTQQALGKLAEAEVAFSGALSINPSMRSAGLNRSDPPTINRHARVLATRDALSFPLN